MQSNPLNLTDLIDLIKYPLVTEKSTQRINFYSKQKINNFYTFIVDKKLTKLTIKLAIESLFNVKVIKVKTLNLPKKKHRVGKFQGEKPNYKKTIVTLAPDNQIDLFSNVFNLQVKRNN